MISFSSLFVSGKNIERFQKEKDIGVTIDSELTFESHICEIVNKATSILGALRRAFRYLDKKLFIPLEFVWLPFSVHFRSYLYVSFYMVPRLSWHSLVVFSPLFRGMQNNTGTL
jgi:hypothetical protein